MPFNYFLSAVTHNHWSDNKMLDSEVITVIVKLIATKSTLHSCRYLSQKEKKRMKVTQPSITGDGMIGTVVESSFVRIKNQHFAFICR